VILSSQNLSLRNPHRLDGPPSKREPVNSSKKKPGVALWASVMVVCPVLYIACLGPSAALVEADLVPLGAWEFVFAPVLEIDEHCHCVERCVRSYVAVCDGSGRVTENLVARKAEEIARQANDR